MATAGRWHVASLAANVAVAEPSMTGRVIAAWPSFALIGSYELLMRRIRAEAPMPLRPIVRSSRAHAASPTLPRTAVDGPPRATVSPKLANTSKWSVSEERAEPLAYAGMLSADFHVGGTLDPAWSTG